MIDQLKSIIGKRGGIARNNLFEASIFPPPAINFSVLRDVPILCESTSLPGRQITSFEYPLFSFRQDVKVPNGYLNADLDVTFLMTNDFSIKELFEVWSDFVIDNRSYTINYVRDYCGTVRIQSLNQKKEKNYEVILLNAWPITLNPIDLDNQTTDDYIRFQVTFTFEDFETVFFGNTPNEIFQP